MHPRFVILALLTKRRFSGALQNALPLLFFAALRLCGRSFFLPSALLARGADEVQGLVLAEDLLLGHLQAIDRLVALAEDGEDVGLSPEALTDALRHVVDSLVGQLTPDNAGDYLDLPDNHRVKGVRRLQGLHPLLPPTLDDLTN